MPAFSFLYFPCSGENVSSAICAYPADASKDNDGVFGVFSNDIIQGEGGEVINNFFEVCHDYCYIVYTVLLFHCGAT